jgi:hypothetical protein
VTWVEVFAVFVVSHLAGDFLLQTDWQAVNKRGGLGRKGEARRALYSHVVSYTLTFVPGLVWMADEIGALNAVGIAALIFVPHLLQDDTRLLVAYNRKVKGGVPGPGDPVFMAIDQSFHIVTLFATALLVVALK